MADNSLKVLGVQNLALECLAVKIFAGTTADTQEFFFGGSGANALDH
jgi:hypothetical protein